MQKKTMREENDAMEDCPESKKLKQTNVRERTKSQAQKK